MPRRNHPVVKKRKQVICKVCKKADDKDYMHPGKRHENGICDCPCRGKR